MQPHMKRSLDLTNLNVSAIKLDIIALCKQAIDNRQHIAAVCSWPGFATFLFEELEGTGIKTAVVINFPHGVAPIEILRNEADLALYHGAQEIDLVIDWQRYNAKGNGIFETVQAVRNLGKGFTLKVILETGEMKPRLIYRASIEAMEAGADFLKTSTGTTDRGAELLTTKYMCEAVKHYYLENSRRVGLKYSGGIVTDLDAMKFIWQLHQYDLGSWLKHDLIRFGVGTSSQVLDQWCKSHG